MLLALLLSLVGISFAQFGLAEEWTASNYPNPRKGGFKQCNMRSTSNICDPDQTLTESERYRLNNELMRLSKRTEEKGNSFCSRKGVDAVLAIANDGSQQLASQLNKLWNLDGQCDKSVVFVLNTDSRKLYYAGEKSTSIDPAEFQAIVSAEDVQLATGSYTSALVNVFKELGKKSNPVSLDNNTLPRVKASATSMVLAPLVLVVLTLL